MQRQLPGHLAAHGWRPFHLHLFSRDNGTGSSWDLASIGLALHTTTQAGSQNPSHGGPADCGLLRVEFSELKAMEIGVGTWMSLGPNHIDTDACFFPSGVENCCQAYRLVGVYLTCYWTRQTWASTSVCSTLRLWSVVLFLTFVIQDTGLLG